MKQFKTKFHAFNAIDRSIAHLMTLVSLTFRVHTPLLQSLPTKLCGWGSYGGSFVTHDTTITATPW